MTDIDVLLTRLDAAGNLPIVRATTMRQAAAALRELRDENARLRGPCESEHPGCAFCMAAGTPVAAGCVCPRCGDRTPTHEFRAACARIAELEREQDALLDEMQKIVQWADAYPLDNFPEPDWAMAAEVLKSNGMTLDSISASNMRHVVDGVGRIARNAIDAARAEGKT